MYQLPPLLGYTLQESYTSRIVNYTNSAVREPSLPTSVLDWPSCKRHGRGGDTGRHAHSRRSQMTSQTNTHNTPPSPKTAPHDTTLTKDHSPERPPSRETRPRETALTRDHAPRDRPHQKPGPERSPSQTPSRMTIPK